MKKVVAGLIFLASLSAFAALAQERGDTTSLLGEKVKSPPAKPGAYSC